VAVQLPALRKRGVSLRLAGGWRGDPNVRRIVSLMLPTALGAGLIQINVCIDGLLALWAAPWGPAAMEYAERLVYLPLGLIGTAFATVLLPTYSRRSIAGDYAGLRDAMARALRNIAVIMAPASIGLIALALPIVTLIYRWEAGRFDGDSASFTARALIGYAPGLLIFSFQKALTPAFYALQDTRTPMRIGIMGVLINVSLSLLFVFTWPAGWKHMGIAVATVITSLVNGLTLAVLLRRRLRMPRLPGVFHACVGAIVAALLMGAAVWLIHDELRSSWFTTWPAKAAQLGAMGGGMAIYFTLARIFCREAVSELLEDLSHRGKRHA
jgi:putative peptidoglycan lipid II flippase